jgi:phage shock protein A
MGFFGKLWAVIRGIFIRAGDDIVSGSPEAIKATYATAIDDSKTRYKEMEKAVALLAREREKTESELKALDQEEKDLDRRLEGALAMAASDSDNPAHGEAGARYIARKNEIDARQAAVTAELDRQRNRVEEYKAQLRKFQDEIARLTREQGEMVAEFVSSQQMIQLEDRLKGLSETSVDASVMAIRDKVGQMKAQAKIATEMRSSTLTSQDDSYERAGAEREAKSRFDELLKARQVQKAGAAEKERDLG